MTSFSGSLLFIFLVQNQIVLFGFQEDETRKNPFDLDIAFHSLPLRTKVEILYDLCDFRLDGDEVQDTLKVSSGLC